MNKKRVDKVVTAKVEEHCDPVTVCSECGDELYQCDNPDCDYMFEDCGLGSRVICCIIKNPEKGVIWTRKHYCEEHDPRKKKKGEDYE